jgi:hypothetical protein
MPCSNPLPVSLILKDVNTHFIETHSKYVGNIKDKFPDNKGFIGVAASQVRINAKPVMAGSKEVECVQLSTKDGKSYRKSKCGKGKAVLGLIPVLDEKSAPEPGSPVNEELLYEFATIDYDKGKVYFFNNEKYDVPFMAALIISIIDAQKKVKENPTATCNIQASAAGLEFVVKFADVLTDMAKGGIEISGLSKLVGFDKEKILSVAKK